MSVIFQNENQYFIASKNIKAYPCGSRGYFDPEAKLNTEYNVRRHTTLNGFTNSFIQSYEEDSDGNININFFVNGYNFEINNLPKSELPAGNIYAEIVLTNRQLYSLTLENLPNSSDSSQVNYDTSVLANQWSDETLALDFETEGIYFFAGLVLTTSDSPLEDNHFRLLLFNVTLVESEVSVEVFQKSLLPVVEHGEAQDSTVIPGALTVKKELVADRDVTLGNENKTSNVALQGNVTINGTVPVKASLEQQEESGSFRLTFITQSPSTDD